METEATVRRHNLRGGRAGALNSSAAGALPNRRLAPRSHPYFRFHDTPIEPRGFRVENYCDGPQTTEAPTSCVNSACCECPECDDFVCDLDDKAELGGICGICKSAIKTSVDDTAKVMDDLGWNCSEATGALWASCNAALDLETDGLALIICTAASGAFKGACNAAGADPKEIIKHDDAIAKTSCKPVCWFHDD